MQERFEAERKAILQAYENGKDIDKTIDGQKEEWRNLYIAIYMDVMKTFGSQLFDQFKSEAVDLEVKAPLIPLEKVFNVFDKAVQKFIASTVAKKVVMVTDNTKGLIRNIIKKQEAQGASIQQIAEQLDKLYLDQIIPNRSTVIARTEVIGASNAGNHFAAQQTELPLQKEWIATRDDRTRETHEDLDGQKVGMEEKFSNGLLFPGDPEGEAKEIIQCRCTVGYSRIK